MELEDWVREDMKRYIKNHEPEIERLQPVRQEHLALVDKDYTRKINEALSQDRFHTAKELFNELKRKFLDLPPTHSRERRAYHRQLQQCYKDIYDWVADRHKTARILQQLTTRTNVFDSSEEPVSMEELRKQRGAPMPTIEEEMVREDELPPLATPQTTAQTQQKRKSPDDTHAEADQQKDAQPDDLGISMPDWEPAEEGLPSTTTPDDQQTPSVPKEQDTPEEQEPPATKPPQQSKDRRAPPPRWDAPDDTPLPHTKPRKHGRKGKTPSPSDEQDPEDGKHAVQKQAAHALLDEAEQLIKDDDTEAAQRKLLEARFELERAGGDVQTLKRIHELERGIGHALKTDAPTPRDAEVFSAEYLRGVQAMAAGDYQAAAHHFLKRVQQTPHDRAAQIRLAECMEALNA